MAEHLTVAQEARVRSPSDAPKIKMSIKIYDGFLIKASSLQEITSILKDFKSEALVYAKKKAQQYIAKNVFHNIDEHLFMQKDGSAPSYADFVLQTVEKLNLQESTNSRSPSIDYSFHISVAPLDESNCLAIPFFEHCHDYSELLASMPWHIPYGYWNNTDRPDDIDQDEWDTRLQNWTKILSPEWVPSETMFSFTIVPDNFILSAFRSSKELVPHAPSDEERIEHLLFLAVVDKAREQYIKEYANFYEFLCFFVKEYSPGGTFWEMRQGFHESVTNYVCSHPVAELEI